MTRPSILLVGSQMTTGGAQRLLLDLAGYLRGQGYPVAAAFLYDKDGLHDRWQGQALFPIYDLASRQPGKSPSLGMLLGGAARLYRLMRQGRFSVVMTFTHHANLIGIPLAWLAGVRVRVASHHGRFMDLSRRLMRLHAALVNSPLTTGLTVISESVRRDALDEGVRASKIAVVYSGIADCAAEPGTREHVRAGLRLAGADLLLLSAGRLEPEKGHLTLIRALPQLVEQFPGLVTALAGGGSLRAALEAEAARLGMAQHVRFLGVRQDVPALMAAADAFVLPSEWEGLGLAVLEAMAAGLPAAASRVGGVVELIKDGQNGVLFPAGDAAALAGAVAGLLSDPQRRAVIAAAARLSYEQNFTLEQMGARYAALFEAALAGRTWSEGV